MCFFKIKTTCLCNSLKSPNYKPVLTVALWTEKGKTAAMPKRLVRSTAPLTFSTKPINFRFHQLRKFKLVGRYLSDPLLERGRKCWKTSGSRGGSLALKAKLEHSTEQVDLWKCLAHRVRGEKISSMKMNISILAKKYLKQKNSDLVTKLFPRLLCS